MACMARRAPKTTRLARPELESKPTRAPSSPTSDPGIPPTRPPCCCDHQAPLALEGSSPAANCTRRTERSSTLPPAEWIPSDSRVGAVDSGRLKKGNAKDLHFEVPDSGACSPVPSVRLKYAPPSAK